MCVRVCLWGRGGGLEASFGSTARDLLSLRLFGWRMSYWLQSSRCVRLAKKTKTKKSFFYQFKLAFQRFIIGGGGGQLKLTLLSTSTMASSAPVMVGLQPHPFPSATYPPTQKGQGSHTRGRRSISRHLPGQAGDVPSPLPGPPRVEHRPDEAAD